MWLFHVVGKLEEARIPHSFNSVSLLLVCPFEVFFFLSPGSSVDNCRGVRGLNNSTYVQIRIHFKFLLALFKWYCYV